MEVVHNRMGMDLVLRIIVLFMVVDRITIGGDSTNVVNVFRRRSRRTKVLKPIRQTDEVRVDCKGDPARRLR